MKRREFLIRVGSVAIWVPAARVLSGCAANDEGGPPSLTFTSSVVDAHSHRLALEVAIIETPPPSGVQPSTSNAAGHVHNVELSEADLVAIRANETVLKMTAADATGHTHQFMFRRSAGTPSTGTDYQTPRGGY